MFNVQTYKSFERDQYTLVVFINLSKAFYTANHSVLIKKLQMYGIRGIDLDWFRSYLANRKQYISLGHDLKTGTQNRVPQGSMLGPLLFCYMLTIFLIPQHLFADDRNPCFEYPGLRIKNIISVISYCPFSLAKVCQVRYFIKKKKKNTRAKYVPWMNKNLKNIKLRQGYFGIISVEDF